MCEHCNGECLKVEEILSLPELQSNALNLEQLQRISREVDKEFKTLSEAEIMQQIRGYELIFLSHPFADDPQANKRRVDFIAKEIREANPEALILSPLHSFSYFDTDDMREAIMYECYQMIEHADTCVFIQYDGFLSSGQSDEKIYAEEIGKDIEVEEVDQLLLDKRLGIR